MNNLPDFKEIRDDSFIAEVNNAPGIVLLEFYRDSCSSCRVFEATINAIAEKYKGQIKFVRLNIDVSGRFHYERLKISGEPTTCIFYKGNMEGKIIGASPMLYFQPMLDQIFSDMEARLGVPVPTPRA